ncbi:MAG: InlB B-repeat-containing protein, partial [Lachnospiraceae bacterium]|nr:InlB B-repeat-containing protein [Lachnospiraceae bacterium]
SYNDKENHVFAGWKLKGDKDGGKVYAAGETYTVTEDVTFVETWKLQEYTVTLTDESGKMTKPEKVEAGKEFTFPETAPTKEGYTFAGWKSEDYDSVYGTGSKCVITEDVTFKETWAQPNDKDYTVKFVDQNDNEIPELTQTVKAGDNPVIILPKPLTERIGYEFEGWYDDWNWNCHKSGTTYTVTRNVVFTENWEEEYYEKGMYIWLDDEEAYYQGGTAVTPRIEVYYNGEELTQGTDYTVKYKNNKNAGKATLTVTGKNNFAKADKKDVAFTIRRKNIEYIDDYATEMTVIENAKVNPVIIYNGKQLKLGKDFTISGTGLENGKYAAATTETDENGKLKPNKLTVTGINNFMGSFDIDVIVVKKGAAPGLAVEIDKNFKPVYDTDELTWATLFGKKETVDGQTVNTPGKIIVYEKGDKDKKALVENTDFQVVMVSGDTYSWTAGTYKFMVVGIGKYTGNVTKSFKISPKPLTESDIQVGVYTNPSGFKTTDLTAEYRSTGSTIKGLTVRYKTGENAGEPTYTEMDSRNYKISYSGNKKVGTGKAKVTFVNDYKGTKAKTVEFKITGASLNSIDAIAPDMVYSKEGKSCVSKPIVEYDGTIIKASEYSVSYAWASASDITIDEKTKEETGYKADDKVQVTLKGDDKYAKVKVTITPSAKSNFILTRTDTAGAAVPETIYYYVRKADTNALDLTKAKVEFFADAKLTTPLKKIPYCGEKFYTPEGNKASNVDGDGAVFVKVTVKVGKTDKVVDPSLYEVTWLNATNKGKATVVIVGNRPEESSGTSAEGTAKEFAVGSKTASATIDAIGRWVPPSNPWF